MRSARRLCALVLFSVAALAPLAARAACPPRERWPGDAWSDRTAATATARAAQIKALEDYAFTLEGRDEERRGIRTDGVVIIRGGEMLYEKYARGWAPEKRHLAWSVTKSLMNALTGAAVEKGLVGLDDSVCKYRQFSDAACRITLRHLLDMSSGLAWKEVYENESNQVSSVLALLYGEGREDRTAFVASHAFRDTPGSTWFYSTGDSTLLGGVLDAALRPVLGETWAWSLFFDRIGMRRATLEADPRGAPTGGSYLWAPPRDLARMGYLFLNDGCWAGERVLPESWVADSVTVSQPFRNKPRDVDPGYVHGRSWWVNTAVPEHGIPQPWPHLPADTYAAVGHWGQYVTVVPSLDVVVVRVGDDRDHAFDFDKFHSLALEVAK